MIATGTTFTKIPFWQFKQIRAALNTDQSIIIVNSHCLGPKDLPVYDCRVVKK